MPTNCTKIRKKNKVNKNSIFEIILLLPLFGCSPAVPTRKHHNSITVCGIIYIYPDSWCPPFGHSLLAAKRGRAHGVRRPVAWPAGIRGDGQGQQAAVGGRQREPGGCLYIKMPSYQYRNSRYKDKTVVRPSYLYNGKSSYSKRQCLYWNRADPLLALAPSPGLGRPTFQPHVSPRSQWSILVSTMPLLTTQKPTKSQTQITGTKFRSTDTDQYLLQLFVNPFPA